MKSILLTLSILLLSLLPAGAVRKIEAHPINMAFMIAQQTDTAKIASMFQYYGYIIQPSEDGYTVYMHPNESVIRYSFKDTDKEQPYPYVDVKSKLSLKEIEDALKNMSFKKDGSGYVREFGKYARSVFRCNHGSQGVLVFHQTMTPIKKTLHK